MQENGFEKNDVGAGGRVERGAGADLAAVDPGFESLIARYPLPKNVADAIVNKRLLATALMVSQTTIDAWLLEGLPVQERGTNGQAYKFRLSIAYAWMQSKRSQEESEAQEAEQAAGQLRLELLGGSGGANDMRARMSPKEQAELLALEKEWMLAAQKRRQLLNAVDMVDAFQVIFIAMRDGIEAAPDRVARELGLDGAAIEKMQPVFDDILIGVQRKIEAFSDKPSIRVNTQANADGAAGDLRAG